MRENVAVADTGSVGPTIAPSTNAASQLIPGTIACATRATPAIVASTSPTASSASGRTSAFNSRGEANQPAASSSGGRKTRKTRKTTSGSSARSGSAGTRPIASPPLSEVHPDAQRAAEASEAAAGQEAFWPMHDALFGARGELGLERVVALAAGLGLDARRVRTELDAGVHAERVAADRASGAATGVAGTPTFFVNGVRHSGAFDAQSLIAMLAAG